MSMEGDISTPEVEVSDVSPEAEASLDSGSESEEDAEEAEYQAAMAKIRGEKKEPEPKDVPEKESSDKDEEQSSDDLKKDESKPEKQEDKESDSKVWKLKVNGEEVEFDASDEGKIKQVVQKGLAADAKFQEAAQMRQQAESFIQALRDNPLEVLQHPSLGINFREVAENYLYKQIQREQMTPEERQREEERSELEKYRQAEAERKRMEEQRQQEEMRTRYQEEWNKKFTSALETGGLPKTDWTISRMAQYMKQAISKGYDHVQPSDVVEYVKQDWINAQRQMFSHLDGDKLLEIIGKETADKIRKANLAKYEKASQSKPESRPQANRQVKNEEGPKFNSLEEMQEAIRLGLI